MGITLMSGFRELSFSRIECGVNDRLHMYPLFGIVYFLGHIHDRPTAYIVSYDHM